MTTHISRDFNPSASGYVASVSFMPYLYNLAIFLKTIMGFSTVGQTGFDINNTNSQTFTNSATTSITAGSNGQSLPQSTINVSSTTGFPASGTVYVTTAAGVQIVTYSGTTSTTFTNCSGGTGLMSTGNQATYGQNKILAATGAPWTITTTFPHGMSTGDYALISGAGVINTAFTPVPVQVLNSTQMVLLTTAGGSGYVANSQTLFPPGMLIASGTGASINFAGAPSTTAVQVPTTSRTVVSGTAPSTGDVGRILVLKSNLYPTKNSGIYKITAVNTATNSYTVDYRSSDTPPPESGMNWWVYEIETQASNYVLLPDNNRTGYGLLGTTNTTPIQVTYNINVVGYFLTGQKVTISGVTGNTNANGTWVATITGGNTLLLNGSSGNGTSGSVGTISRPGYSGNNVNSRIILQSPHATGWQVRIAIEPFNVPAVVPFTSICVGAGGNSSGDFPVGGVTTHVAEYLDITIPGGSPYINTYTGSAIHTAASRVTIVGDDGGRSLFLYTRTLGAGSNGLLALGLPDNEPTPLPININRPFVYGGCNAGPDYGGIQMRIGTSSNLGFTFRDQNPEVCAIAGWANADGVSGTSPVYSANAGDCPFTNTTEVLPWEIWGGIATDPALALPIPANGGTIYGLNQRFMGTAPFIRQGRTNFGTFTLSTDNTTAFSVSTTSGAAVSPIQITTSASNALVTGQTVVISGVLGNTAANGTFVITVIDNTHFTLNNTTGNGNYTSGGTGNGTQQWLHLQNGIYLAWNGASGLTP